MPVPKIQTGLSIDEPTYNKLKYIADEEKRSINNLVEYVLSKYLSDYESSHGQIPDQTT